MAATDHAALLAAIRDQRAAHPLSILTLAEPILSEQTDTSSQKQTSNNSINDSSAQSDSGVASLLSPTTLSVDLQHYRDLFSKLRFSYLEQVTKEKYLRSIVGDPPVLVTHDENLALEETLSTMKADLKAKKEDNERLVQEIEVLATKLAEKYEAVNDGLTELEVLPNEIAELESQVQEVRDALRKREEEMELGDNQSDDPRMNMSLADTEAAVEEQRLKMREVEEQIAVLQGQIPVKMRECERVERELEELEGRRNEVTRLARDVQRVKEEGGRDLLEERGRWLRGEEAVLRGLLGVEG